MARGRTRRRGRRGRRRFPGRLRSVRGLQQLPAAMTPERFAKLTAAVARRQPDLTVLMDAVNKSHNISAIIRTADAVGVHRIHALSTGGALRRHHMIAGGAKHYVALTLHGSTAAALAALRAEGWGLIAAHSGAGA